MTTFDKGMLIIAVLLSFEGSYNAREAHRHTHELGCAMDYAPLCDWHRLQP